METPLFQQRAEATIARCAEIFTKRGDVYGDTWKNCQHRALRAVLFQVFGIKPSASQCRAMAAAALVDIKYSRLEGGYNEDHLLDGINYQAFLADEMCEVYREAATSNGSQPLHTLD